MTTLVFNASPLLLGAVLFCVELLPSPWLRRSCARRLFGNRDGKAGKCRHAAMCR